MQQAETSDTEYSFYVIFYLQTTKAQYGDAAEGTHRSKAKKKEQMKEIYPFMASMTKQGRMSLFRFGKDQH